MRINNIIFSLFLLSILNSCAQNAALVGPAYTFATSGNIYHAGLTYGSGAVIEKTTGKSATQNIKELFVPDKKDSEFERIVKKRISETREKLDLSNQ